MRYGLAAALVLALYLVALGDVPLQLPDEPREAAIARETWVNGAFTVARVNGVFHPVKPPLAYSVAAAIFSLSGERIPTERAVRTTSALFTIATALALFFLGRSWFSVRHGVLAALVFATSPEVISHGRRFTSDPALTFFVTCACGFALSSLRSASLRSFAALAIGAGASTGLAFLAKGPIGPILIAIAVGGGVALDRGARELATKRTLALAGIALALLLPAVVFWVALLRSEGGDALVREWIDFHRQGAGGSQAAHPAPWWFYAQRAPDGVLPWLIVLPLAWSRDARSTFRLRQLVPWIVGGVLFLSLLRQKRDLYTLPLVPPVAILASCAILDARLAGRAGTIARTLWSVFAWGAIGWGVLVPLGCAAWTIALGGAPASSLEIGVALALAAGAVLVVVRRDPDEAASPLPSPIRTASLVAVGALALIVFVEPRTRSSRTLRPLAHAVAVAVAREPDAHLHGYQLVEGTGVTAGALSYELGRTFPDLDTPEKLRHLLATDPRALVIVTRVEHGALGKPGRVVGEFSDERRAFVLIAP